MARYSDTLTDQAGLPIAGALIQVSIGGIIASLTYDDNSPIVQPFKTDELGGFYFNAGSGLYTLEFYFGGRLIQRWNSIPVGTLVAAVNPSPTNAGKFIVLDAGGYPTYSTGTGADAGLRTDLAAAGGASLVKTNSGSTVQESLFLIPSLTPSNAFTDLVVPNAGNFVDNVLSIQNKSKASGAGGNYGNAAIRFLDGGGTERAAVGYSRNSSIQPNGYYPDTMYVEVGNPFTTDANPSSFAVISTMGAGGPYFPGSSLKAGEYNSKTSNWFFRHFPGGSINIGDTGNPMTFRVQGNSSSICMREYDGAENFSVLGNVSNVESGSGGGVVRQNTSLAGWKVSLNSTEDCFSVSRIGGSETAWQERFRVDPFGRILVNSTTTASGSDGQIAVTATGLRSAITSKNNTATTPVQIVYNTATTGDNGFIQFATETTYTIRGNIGYNRAGGTVNYGTTSDYRSKTDKGDLTGSLDRIVSLRPIIARMNGATQDVHTFIAHEVQAVIPQAVSGAKDAIDDKGNPVMQQVDMSKIVPDLVAAIKELKAKVSALEAK